MVKQFLYDKAIQKSVAIDGTSHLDPWSAGKDGTYSFCLFWDEKKIIIKAVQKQSISINGQIVDEWIIYAIGSPGREVDAYRCASQDDFRELTDVAKSAF